MINYKPTNKPASFPNNLDTPVSVKSELYLDFYPLFLGDALNPKNIMNFEPMIFYFANHLCSEYQGGTWVFVECSNGAKFSYPDIDGELSVLSMGMDTHVIRNSKVLGICCCVFALQLLATKQNDSKLAHALYEKINLLTDYYKDTEELSSEEKTAIYKILD